MSGEKKRYRWRRGPVLLEENFIINSTSTTTITTKTEEGKHTENIQRKWHNNNEDIQLTSLQPNETISEKIDRILRKINAWTNDTTIPTKVNRNDGKTHEKVSFNKPVHSSTYYNTNCRNLNTNNFPLHSSFNTVRQRCSSSTYENPSMMRTRKISNTRPYSMTFIDEPCFVPSLYKQYSLYERPNSTIRTFCRQSSLDSNRYPYQRRSICSPNTNSTASSSLYGSDFFFPPKSEQEQEQHEYDNLNFINNSPHQHCDPFPTVVIDCQRCSRSVLRDMSCQVPSDDEFSQDIELPNKKTTRSSPVYVSPRSSPSICNPPLAKTLLAPHHYRRKRSLSSYISLYNRSKSVPSSSSTTSSSISNHMAGFSPIEKAPKSDYIPSTTTILRSIKTSINAMKNRLKDMRRLSEDSNVTTVLDDYTARSPQELSVSKGQHVRVVQKQLPNAPDWCLIRLLNDHHQQQQQQQQNQSIPSSTVASSIVTTSGSADLTATPLTKYTEGLVPAAILKLSKSSSSSTQLPPPLTHPLAASKSEQDAISNTIDEPQSGQTSSTFQIGKQKSSFKRILKAPVRRHSLKENSINSKDGKTSDSQNLKENTTPITSPDTGDGTSVNNNQLTSSNSSISRKIKGFTFKTIDNSTTFPDRTNSINKSLVNGDVNDIYKMTESSSSSSTVMTMISSRNNLENDIIEIPSSFDIQSQRTTTIDTNIDPSQAAPINIVSGLSATDFQIPAALSVTTPATDDASTNSMPSSSMTTVIPNDNPSEQTDEISLNEVDQIALSSLTTNDEPVDPRTKYGAKRRHNIIELIETEKEYVKDLALIVEGYMNVIENDKDIKKPTGLIGRERVVFGNIQRIYEFHRDTFLPQLEQCIENPNTLGRLFTTNRFSPYVKYCENKPRSEYIVSEYHDYFEDIRKKLGQKLLVSDLLIKPVQRIMRYQLLLKEILKSTERMGDEPRAIRSALQVMIEVPQQANDMMNVARIKDLPTNVHQLGELKFQDMLSVSEPISSKDKDSKDMEKKLKERRVFLFQQSMIFCDEIPAKDKYSSPTYIYKYELKINKLQHKEFKRNKEACQFTLVEFDVGSVRRVVCQCKDDEQYESWVTSVNKVLQRQMDLIIALTNPTAALQKELLTWETPEWREAGRRRFTTGDMNANVSSKPNT